MIYGKNNEAHIPAFGRATQAHARVSGPHADARRPGGDSSAAGKRAGTPGRLRRTERYRKVQRLRTEAITQLLASTRPRRAGAISVQARSNGLQYPRLGLVIPKRLLSRAVDRNRAKRLLREWFRRNQTRLGGKDVLVRLGTRPAQMGSLIVDIERLLATDR